jgi:hypothetical protein
MPFTYHSFVKITDKITGEVIKNFEDECTRSHYMTNCKRDFNMVNNKDIEIVKDRSVKLTIFTSYPSLVEMNVYDDKNYYGPRIAGFKKLCDDNGITIFSEDINGNKILLVFHYVANIRDGLMSTKVFTLPNGEKINAYKNSVHTVCINRVDKNPGWVFPS